MIGKIKQTLSICNMINVKSTGETFDKIIENIKAGKKFSYTRYGDGEIRLMRNADDTCQIANPDLVKELIECINIEHEDFMIGSITGQVNEPGMTGGLFASFPFDEGRQKILKGFTNKVEFYNAVPFHYKLIFESDAITKIFIPLLRSKKLALVGGKHLSKINLPIDTFVETPATNAYKDIEKFYPDVLNINADIILLGVGATASVIQKRLWRENKKVITLDMGSFLDGLLGLGSRTWINLKKDYLIKLLK